MSSKNQGLLLVILSTFAFGCMGTLAKFVYREGITPLQLLCVRFFLATIVMLPLLRWMKKPLWISKEALLHYLLLGICYAGSGFLYFFSVSRMDASIVALVLSFYPAQVCMICALFYREPLDKKQLFFLFLSLVAVFMILSPRSAQAPDSPGVFAALGASLAYALYTKGLDSPALRNMDSVVNTFYIMLFASLILIPAALLRGESLPLTTPTPLCIVLLLLLAFFSTNVAIFSFYVGVKRLGSVTASIVSNLEVMIGVFLPILFWNERLTALQWLGSALLLYAILRVSLLKNAPQTM